MKKNAIDLPRMTTNFLVKILVTNLCRDWFETITNSLAVDNRPSSICLPEDLV